MKAYKLVLAGILAMGMVTAASVQTTYVRIAGSTAFRKATHQAIGNIYSSHTVGFSGTDLTKASQAIFKGTIPGIAGTVIIKASWSGSVGGVADLTQNRTVGPGGTAYPNGGGGWLVDTTPAGPNAPPNYDKPITPDVAMSDSYQKSTAFTSPALTDTLVGVIPFVWVKSVGNSTTVAVPNNFTQSVASQLLNGQLSNIQCIGRDEDSGTHCISYIFAGLNGFAQTPDKQFQPTIAGGVITSTVLWPGPVTVDGRTYPTGHSGYASGGTLATTLNTPTKAGITTAYVGYLGVNDAQSVNAGHNNLLWNNVAFTPAAVQKGQYNFWGYEHLLYRSSLAGTQKTVANTLAKRILNFDASASGVIIETMSFHRTADGGPLLPGDE